MSTEESHCAGTQHSLATAAVQHPRVRCFCSNTTPTWHPFLFTPPHPPAVALQTAPPTGRHPSELPRAVLPAQTRDSLRKTVIETAPVPTLLHLGRLMRPSLLQHLLVVAVLMALQALEAPGRGVRAQNVQLLSTGSKKASVSRM